MSIVGRETATGSRTILRAATKNFWPQMVVRDADLDIGQCELCTTLGASGSGEATSFCQLSGPAYSIHGWRVAGARAQHRRGDRRHLTAGAQITLPLLSFDAIRFGMNPPEENTAAVRLWR